MTADPIRRPAHLRPALIAWVVAGGAVGSTLRSQIATAFPTSPGHWPWTTFLINVSGALLLGLLLELLSMLAPSERLRAPLQLGIGTGVIGGYTTYSSFAVETISLGAGGAVWVAAGYALVSVVAGLLAAGAAMWAVRRVLGPRRGVAR